MKQFPGTTIEEAVGSVAAMKRCRPFEYGGTWYLTQTKEPGWWAGFRTKQAAAKRANGPVFKLS